MGRDVGEPQDGDRRGQARARCQAVTHARARARPFEPRAAARPRALVVAIGEPSEDTRAPLLRRFSSVDVQNKKGLKLAKMLGLAGSMPVVAMVNHKDGAEPVVLMQGEVQELTRIRKKVLHNTKTLSKVDGYWQKEA